LTTLSIIMIIGVDIPDEIINSILLRGMESPYSYWAKFENKRISPDSSLLKCNIVEIETGDLKKISTGSIYNGLRLMATKKPAQFARIIEGTFDGETGDILIQMSVFGAIKYE